MLKALRFLAGRCWPACLSLLIIQRYPQWVGLPSLDVNLQQAPQTTSMQQGPVSYADAVTTAAPSVVNLYTTKVINKPATRCSKTRSSAVSSATTRQAETHGVEPRFGRDHEPGRLS
jgi:S1-C subfamily serine protease